MVSEVGFEPTPLTPKGEVKLQGQYEEKSCEINFQVLDQNLTPLLSAETYLKLGLLTLNIEETCKVETIENIFESFPDVFEGLGRLLGKYHVEIDPEVRPVQHGPRNVPVALKADLKKKQLRSLLYVIMVLRLSRSVVVILINAWLELAAFCWN